MILCNTEEHEKALHMLEDAKRRVPPDSLLRAQTEASLALAHMKSGRIAEAIDGGEYAAQLYARLGAQAKPLDTARNLDMIGSARRSISTSAPATRSGTSSRRTPWAPPCCRTSPT